MKKSDGFILIFLLVIYLLALVEATKTEAILFEPKGSLVPIFPYSILYEKKSKYSQVTIRKDGVDIAVMINHPGEDKPQERK